MKANIGRFQKNNRRKVNIQIDRFDTWSLDSSLAYIIYPALLQLKMEKHGVPSEFGMVGGEDWNAQSSFDFYSDTVDESFNISIKQWDEVMDKMIWSFLQLLTEDYDEKYHSHNFAQGVNDDHWYDAEGSMLHEERIQEGLELFGKYYRSLWD